MRGGRGEGADERSFRVCKRRGGRGAVMREMGEGYERGGDGRGERFLGFGL